MAYQIEFTASTWRHRRCRKAFLRLLLLALVIAAVWGVYDVYETYNQPTLNMKLAEYESVARPIDEMNAAWDKAASEYNVIAHYYRLVWASNPTNFLQKMAAADANNKALDEAFHSASCLVGKTEEALKGEWYKIGADNKKKIIDAVDALKTVLGVLNHDVMKITQKRDALLKAIEPVATNACWIVCTQQLAIAEGDYQLPLHKESINGAPGFGRGYFPKSWLLKTGGECRLDYRYVFRPGDKAEQAKGIETVVVNAVTSILQVANGKVDVQGVRQENLLNVGELDVSARFSLPDVKSFPVKERVLADCVKEIALMRKKVQETKILDGKNARLASTAQAIMMAYLSIGKDKPDFPAYNDVLNVSGWFERADQFIAKNNIPGNDSERLQLKQTWNKVGDARFPWDRFRALDNDDLVACTKELMTVSDGVKRFKTFLEKRHSDCRKKIEPFVEAYDRNKVFNEPFVESDLRDRVAKPAGIDSAVVSFREESGVEPAVLEKADEKFTFTWVRWTLAVGNGERRTGNKELLTLASVADCVRRVLELGPGYALDKVTVNFNGDGSLSDAVVEGLLPVKKVESKKGIAENVN